MSILRDLTFLLKSLLIFKYNLAQKTVQQDLTHFFHQWLDAPIIPDILEYGLYKKNYQ